MNTFQDTLNWLPPRPARIAVAMSGGMDSNVTAHLLKQAGHEIIGLTAWTLNGPGKCCNDALINAGRVCEQLGCEFDTLDLRAEFSHYVMDYYNNSYAAGLTPNPCVECNRYVKWERLVNYAVTRLGVDYVATGHYVSLARPQGALGDIEVRRAVDSTKDQTYMLARVRTGDLKRALFPLGGWTKQETLAFAESVGLETKGYKESMDVCFVLDGQANYLKSTLGIKKGPVVDIDTGMTVGEHDGHWLFTRGQRRGVGVAAGRPVYVIKTDGASNTVFIGDGHHLETHTFRVTAVNWIAPPPTASTALMVKVRYATAPQLATVSPDPNQAGDWLVSSVEPWQAVTPGQVAAFYDETDTQLLGGGLIEQWLGHQPFNAEAVVLPDLNCTV
jgi:tRNA-uridine 2-sulfurtransferase